MRPLSTIRPASPADAPAVAALVERAYARYVPRIGRRLAPMDDDYAALIAAGEVFVREESGELVGVIVLRTEPDHLLVDNVAVEPGRHGLGLARALLEFAERTARERGLPELRLYTNEAMTENIALYRRAGWEQLERRAERGFARVYFRKRRPSA